MNFYIEKKIVIGLTGPSGCGKTEVASFLKTKGFLHLNCDEIVKQLYLSNEELISKINKNFHGAVRNNVINKKKLAQIVFSNVNEKLKLEKIVWPYVKIQLKNFLKLSKTSVVIDAPVLFESGAFKLCGVNVAILSNFKIRMHRIILRDRISAEIAMARVKVQPSDVFYLNKADCLILNDGNKKALFKCVLAYINKIKKYY